MLACCRAGEVAALGPLGQQCPQVGLLQEGGHLSLHPWKGLARCTKLCDVSTFIPPLGQSSPPALLETLTPALAMPVMSLW